ncbi:MAG: monovalent cation/H+ antiporter subunit D family protein [Mobilicoccus sp.]|nr:monovalent cation/H+ antiporter subunit D family protein [Mobilicoccus sp.]
MSPSLLPLFVAVPLVVGGAQLLLPKAYAFQRTITLLTLGGLVAAALYLVTQVRDGSTLAHSVSGWVPGIGIVFAADTFSALVLVVTGLLTFVGAWFAAASGEDRVKFFGPLVLILMSGVFGAILTADIFNLFVFIEVMLLPSYALIMVSRPGRASVSQVSASRIYVTVNLMTSTILVAGVGLVYGITGTVNLGQLAGAGVEDARVAVAAGVVMMALCVKAAVVPVHGWLSRTYPYMPPAVTALFSGLHTKVATYAIYRLYSVIFDGDERFLWIGIVLFSATMLIGVLGAVGEMDARSILAFHMVSQLGYILLGVAIFTQFGLTAGIFYLLHHMIVKASLFLSIGAVEHSYGRYSLGTVKGLLQREPVTAVVFLLAALSLAGIPPLSGFVAKLTLVVAAWEAGHIIPVAIAVLVSLFTVQSMMKIWGKMFLGDPRDGDHEVLEQIGTSGSRVPVGLIAPAAVLSAITLTLGLGAQILMPLAATAAAGLLDPTSFVEAVLSS